ncbi:MAG: GTPase Era [Bacillota bacterium]|jgi:GTP-binding protein Era
MNATISSGAAVRQKSGFVALVGRPNVGKSSLLNALIGQKITITSAKPQTTRNQLRGILTGDHYQIVWLDTPGLHRPLHQLGTQMVEQTRTALRHVDLALWMLDAAAGYTPVDQKVAAQLAVAATPLYVVWNKMDLVAAGTTPEEIPGFNRVFQVSVHSGQGLAELLAAVVDALPEGPFYYPPDQVADHPERFIVAELIREQVLTYTEDEVPHAVAVLVDQLQERPGGKIYIAAQIFVERDSQKGIIIGAKGARLKKIGAAARPLIEELLDAPVYLDLWVKVRKNWRNQEKDLKEFGYWEK